jgi:hypothetical protein
MRGPSGNAVLLGVSMLFVALLLCPEDKESSNDVQVDVSSIVASSFCGWSEITMSVQRSLFIVTIAEVEYLPLLWLMTGKTSLK